MQKYELNKRIRIMHLQDGNFDKIKWREREMHDLGCKGC